MRKMLLASASLLASALPIAAYAQPVMTHAPIILVAEGMGLEFQSELQTAQRAITAHDMKTAMQALDRAAAMVHDNPAMAPMMTRITQTKQMLTAGDMTGANRTIDSLLSESSHIGSAG